MKKWVISLTMLLLLTGCRSTTELERGMALRSSLLQAQQVRFRASVTGDYGDKSCLFQLDTKFDNQGNMTFTVTEPESINGISGHIRQQAGDIVFDDTVLYFDPMTDEQISPISAPWIFINALRTGYLKSACKEKDLLRLTMGDRFEEGGLLVDVWTNESGVPVRCEIVSEGRRIMTVHVTDFVFM